MLNDVSYVVTKSSLSIHTIEITARDGLTQQPTPLTPTGQTASVSLSLSAPLLQSVSDAGHV